MAVRPTLILMAEDSPTDAELARQAFKTDDATDDLVVVPDGVEALAFMRKEGKYSDVARPDLIVLDLNMPKKDGRQVLIELKADERFRQIPVIILTTSADDQDIIAPTSLTPVVMSPNQTTSTSFATSPDTSSNSFSR